MARKRLLVVEDYRQLRDLIAMVLQEVGRYAVETAADSTVAERFVVRQPFDLVILDISIPGRMSGREIASLARRRLGCPILLITGLELAAADRADLMQPGDRFLRKPFKLDVLLREVANLLKVDAPNTLSSPNPAQGASRWMARAAFWPRHRDPQDHVPTLAEFGAPRRAFEPEKITENSR